MKQETVVFIEKLVPLGARNRVGMLMDGPDYITIHETSLGTHLVSADRDVSYYTNMIMHPTKKNDFAGYHYLVSDNLIIRFVPDNECTYHTGNKTGNLTSIGIERLVNVNVNQLIAISNQAMVTATLMAKYNILLSNVVPHKFWSSKQCPARILAGLYGGWSGFIGQVSKFYNEKQFLLELF